ncbi:TatD family hydrolase [Rapidithrix thailandica]|uniref:TatD family hydrolase n=1 Tax=Rapidithrix thailandica TaxID=413964 RepID=A0AAW9S126_9BACT
MIDSHAHIYSSKFSKDRESVLQRAREAGVTQILMPNIDSSSIVAMFGVEDQHPDFCKSMMGLHPCSVKEDFEKELEIVEMWLSTDKRNFVAVGEMGLDLYWDKSFYPQQAEAFKIQVAWAKKYALPVVLHARDAMSETIALLEELKDEKLTGVLHCFTGSLEEAQQLIEMGFYLGIGGVATFKKGGLDKVLPHIPLEQLLLETDCPYLAPVPYRGKRNEPGYTRFVAEKVAEYQHLDIQEVIAQTTANTKQLFKL